MPKLQDADAVFITLTVENEQALAIVLTREGTINRQGTGSAVNTERDLYVGVTKDDLFESLLSNAKEEWLDHAGAYRFYPLRGALCQLSILFQFGGESTGLAFEYGTQSQGPPTDIREFVLKAVEITQPWYDAQKKMVTAVKPRSWWRFW